MDVQLDPSRNPNSTSIMRPRRLMAPPTMLKDLGWSHPGTYQVRLEEEGIHISEEAADGIPTRLSAKGFVLPPDNFGMHTGDVVKWTPTSTGVLARSVDGMADPSFTHPVVDDAGLAIPPSWLVQAFTSVPNSYAYLQSGRQSANALSRLVASAGASLNTMERIMDFGGGAGRVLRAIHADSNAELVCYDLHQPSMEWCRTHMAFGRWQDGHETPPLDESTGTFDLIYAASVLTHLNEVQQDAWLSEWHRLLRPGGLLIPTFRSEDFVSRVIYPKSAEYADQIRAGLRDGGGFTYISNDGWEGIFPGFYSDAYHTLEYVRSHWGESFEVMSIVLNGSLAGRQDVAVLRKTG